MTNLEALQILVNQDDLQTIADRRQIKLRTVRATLYGQRKNKFILADLWQVAQGRLETLNGIINGAEFSRLVLETLKADLAEGAEAAEIE